MVRLFGSGGKEAFVKRWTKANTLYDNGESKAARREYERLVPDAERLFGPETEEMFALRGSLANTYTEEEPARARELLERVVVDCERTFGPGDARCFPERLDLASARGAAGDHAACHELSLALIGDCKRQLGPDHEKTALARQLATLSGDDLVQPELARLLDLDQKSLSEEAAPTDWQERLRRCVESIRAASSYRTRLAIRSWGASESGAMTDLVTYLAPDRFHVRQLMWDDVKEAESGEPMYDEWFMLGSEYYDPFIGAMVAANAADPGALQVTGRGRKAMNERIVADAYVGLLEDGEPRLSARRGYGLAYLVAEYPAVSSPLFDYLDDLTRQSTTLWIDLSDNTLRRAALVLEAEAEGEHIHVMARHGFASYNDEITIAPPPGLPGATLTA